MCAPTLPLRPCVPVEKLAGGACGIAAFINCACGMYVVRSRQSGGDKDQMGSVVGEHNRQASLEKVYMP